MSEHAVMSSIEPDTLTLPERHGPDRSMSGLAQPRQLQAPLEALLILSLIGCAIGFLMWRGFGSRKGRALVRRLRQQLPRELRQRLTISILPGAPTELPTACYRAGDREFGIQVCENGLISETALAHLCAILDHHRVSA